MKTDDIKKMGQAYVQVLEADMKTKKPAMDPVGKHDADIDNDGDTDKSDEYLIKRRKAISANVKEEKDEKGEGKAHERAEKKKGDVEEALVGNQHKIDANKNGKIDAHDFKLLKKKTQNEEVELDEISKKTLGSYIKKAASDIGSAAAADDTNKELKRHKGIAKAANKLTKEEVEPTGPEVKEWTIFNRILEKLSSYKVSGVGDDPHDITTKFAIDSHTKGATAPEAIDSKASQGEKDFTNKHGGLGKKTPPRYVDDTILDQNPNQFGAPNVKAAPGRHNDSTIGDKAIIKSKS